MSTTGERLREERKRLGLTQSAFAALGDVTKTTQINYEQGRRKPDTEYLASIQREGVDVIYVLSGQREGDPRPDQLDHDEAQLIDDYRDLWPGFQDHVRRETEALALLSRSQRRTSSVEQRVVRQLRVAYRTTTQPPSATVHETAPTYEDRTRVAASKPSGTTSKSKAKKKKKR